MSKQAKSFKQIKIGSLFFKLYNAGKPVRFEDGRNTVKPEDRQFDIMIVNKDTEEVIAKSTFTMTAEVAASKYLSLHDCLTETFEKNDQLIQQLGTK